MSALARNDITFDSTRAVRDHLRLSNWAPFQSPTNAAVFTKGSALGGFGLCWKRFCYAAMLLVVPLVISLVYLKVLACSRCKCFHFLDENIWKQSIHSTIVEKQMLRWWLWHLGVGTSCIRLHIVAKGNIYIYTDSAVPPICFVCSQFPTVSYGQNSIPQPAASRSKRGNAWGNLWSFKTLDFQMWQMISGVIVVYDEFKNV